jgi:hypothetical protein
MPRNFTVHEAPQGTPEWLAARVGRVTASRADAFLLEPKRKGLTELAMRADYRRQLVFERLTGTTIDEKFVSPDMQRGMDLEPAARQAYEARTGAWVEQVGCLLHTELMAGGSPDGVIGDYDGLIEIKCPRPDNHLRYMQDTGVPKEHEPQCLHLLWLTGAPWIDFVSYCPALPSRAQLYVARMVATDEQTAWFDGRVRTFLDEVTAEYLTVMGVS